MVPPRHDQRTSAKLQCCSCFGVDDDDDDSIEAPQLMEEFPKTRRARVHSCISSMQSATRSLASLPIPLPDMIIWIVFKMLQQDADDLRSYKSALCVNKQFARIGSSLLRPQGKCPSLPDELLVEIFSAVRFNLSSTDAAADLASSLRVCRQWYRAGMPLLYKHFVIDCNYRLAFGAGEGGADAYYWPMSNDQYDFVPSARFYDATTRLWAQPWTIVGLGSWICSLSIAIHFAEEQVNREHEQSIQKMVRRLPNLHTLSLRAAPLRQNACIQNEGFVAMIERVPERIRNFELNLQTRDPLLDSTSVSYKQLCQALAKLVPQLQSLRLRLSSMCALFLQDLIRNEHGVRVWPNLRSLSISLYNRDFGPQTRCCNSANFNVFSSRPNFFMDSLQGFLTDAKLFPDLKACSLISLRNDMAAAGTMTKRIICKNFNPQLRTWSKRAYYPYFKSFSQPFYFRTDEDGDENELCMRGWNDRDFAYNSMPHSFPNKLTHSRATDELLEGAAAWTEDAVGARYPPKC